MTDPRTEDLLKQLASLRRQVKFLYFLVILVALAVAALWAVQIFAFLLDLWPVWLIALGCLAIWYFTSRGDKASTDDEAKTPARSPESESVDSPAGVDR